MSYTAIFERDPDGRWTVSAAEVKGCHSYGRSIDEARRHLRDALSLFVEDADRAEIVDDIRLPARVLASVTTARDLRAVLARTEREMVTRQRQAIRELRRLKLGLRDAGELLGLSHQRVAQLESVSAAKKR